MDAFEVDGVTYRPERPGWRSDVWAARRLAELLTPHECSGNPERCGFDAFASQVDDDAKALQLPAEGCFVDAYYWQSGDPVVRFGGVS
jgi:hypothetical protein